MDVNKIVFIFKEGSEMNKMVKGELSCLALWSYDSL